MTEMSAFEVDLASLQPSQLYICAKKLAKVEQATEKGNGVITEPVPVTRMASRMVLTDGHTRAVAALRRGSKTIQACWEDEDLDWEAYGICVNWCLAAGIRSVSDLTTRIVSANRYETLWYARCRALHRHLARQRTIVYPDPGRYPAIPIRGVRALF